MTVHPARLARRRLDERFAALRPCLADQARPSAGWIRTLRTAVGMSTTELAARMGVDQSRIPAIERDEPRGALRMNTLERAADALDCDLVYFLVPRARLDDAVREQARRKARAAYGPISHSMRLEDDEVPAGALADQIDDLAETYVDRRGLWTVSEGR